MFDRPSTASIQSLPRKNSYHLSLTSFLHLGGKILPVDIFVFGHGVNAMDWLFEQCKVKVAVVLFSVVCLEIGERGGRRKGERKEG